MGVLGDIYSSSVEQLCTEALMGLWKPCSIMSASIKPAPTAGCRHCNGQQCPRQHRQRFFRERTKKKLRSTLSHRFEFVAGGRSANRHLANGGMKGAERSFQAPQSRDVSEHEAQKLLLCSRGAAPAAPHRAAAAICPSTALSWAAGQAEAPEHTTQGALCSSKTPLRALPSLWRGSPSMQRGVVLTPSRQR